MCANFRNLRKLSPTKDLNSVIFPFETTSCFSPRWLHQQQMHIMASLNPKNVWEDYLLCPHHRGMVMSLSCALQVITMCCPSALVWVIPSRSKGELLSPTAPMDDSIDVPSNQPEEGSPLDILPVAPSELPLPFSEMDGNEIAADTKDQLIYLEEMIRNRSMAVEQRWSSAKYQESSFGLFSFQIL